MCGLWQAAILTTQTPSDSALEQPEEQPALVSTVTVMVVNNCAGVFSGRRGGHALVCSTPTATNLVCRVPCYRSLCGCITRCPVQMLPTPGNLHPKAPHDLGCAAQRLLAGASGTLRVRAEDVQGSRRMTRRRPRGLYAR